MATANRISLKSVAKPEPPLRPAPADRGSDPESVWDDEYRWDWIAENAYYRAERRGFEPGHEVEDWLAAEGDLEQLRIDTRATGT
jgi:hypothetical protein